MRLVVAIAGGLVALALAEWMRWHSGSTTTGRTPPVPPQEPAAEAAKEHRRRLTPRPSEPSSNLLGAVPGGERAQLPPLPRRLADIHSSPQAKAAIQHRYGGSPQYLAGVDTQLEVLARLDECIGSQVVDGYLDLHLWSDPDAKNHIQHIKPMVEKIRTDNPVEEEIIQHCVETRLSGITEPTVDPKFDLESSVTKMWITFPIRENVAYRFLTTGERIAPKYADEMPEVAEEKRLEALAKQFATEAVPQPK